MRRSGVKETRQYKGNHYLTFVYSKILICLFSPQNGVPFHVRFECTNLNMIDHHQKHQMNVIPVGRASTVLTKITKLISRRAPVF